MRKKTIPTKYHLFIDLIAYGKESVRQDCREFAGNFHIRFVNYFVQAQYVRNGREKKIKLVGVESGRIISLFSIKNGGIKWKNSSGLQSDRTVTLFGIDCCGGRKGND